MAHQKSSAAGVDMTVKGAPPPGNRTGARLQAGGAGAAAAAADAADATRQARDIASRDGLPISGCLEGQGRRGAGVGRRPSHAGVGMRA